MRLLCDRFEPGQSDSTDIANKHALLHDIRYFGQITFLASEVTDGLYWVSNECKHLGLFRFLHKNMEKKWISLPWG